MLFSLKLLPYHREEGRLHDVRVPGVRDVWGRESDVLCVCVFALRCFITSKAPQKYSHTSD